MSMSFGAAGVAPKLLRKISKLSPCDRHLAYWTRLPRSRRMQNAVEGGNSTPCERGDCILASGTDFFEPGYVRQGPTKING